jgi:hypothetical protein
VNLADPHAALLPNAVAACILYKYLLMMTTASSWQLLCFSLEVMALKTGDMLVSVRFLLTVDGGMGTEAVTAHGGLVRSYDFEGRFD